MKHGVLERTHEAYFPISQAPKSSYFVFLMSHLGYVNLYSNNHMQFS